MISRDVVKVWFLFAILLLPRCGGIQWMELDRGDQEAIIGLFLHFVAPPDARKIEARNEFLRWVTNPPSFLPTDERNGIRRWWSRVASATNYKWINFLILQLLSIRGSSADVERIFARHGRLHSHWRASISGSSVEWQLKLHDLLRNKKSFEEALRSGHPQVEIPHFLGSVGCSPALQFFFKQTLRKMKIRAAMQIAPGDKISVSFLEETRGSRKALKSYECHCERRPRNIAHMIREGIDVKWADPQSKQKFLPLEDDWDYLGFWMSIKLE